MDQNSRFHTNPNFKKCPENLCLYTSINSHTHKESRNKIRIYFFSWPNFFYRIDSWSNKLSDFYISCVFSCASLCTHTLLFCLSFRLSLSMTGTRTFCLSMNARTLTHTHTHKYWVSQAYSLVACTRSQIETQIFTFNHSTSVRIQSPVSITHNSKSDWKLTDAR